MEKLTILLSGLILFVQYSSAQIIFDKPLSDRITGYKINATLDTSAKEVDGYMEAFWVNKSTDAVPDIQLHMYMNAFRNNKTTVRSEAEYLKTTKKSNDGWINIKIFHRQKWI